MSWILIAHIAFGYEYFSEVRVDGFKDEASCLVVGKHMDVSRGRLRNLSVRDFECLTEQQVKELDEPKK